MPWHERPNAIAENEANDPSYHKLHFVYPRGQLLRSCSRNYIRRMLWRNSRKDWAVAKRGAEPICISRSWSEHFRIRCTQSPSIVSRLIWLYFSKEHARPASGAFGMRNSFLGWNRLVLLHLLLLPVTATITG
jgi:hypothetical protein